MPVGIPTSSSHDRALADLLAEFNNLLVVSERVAREARVAMAAGAVTDLQIREVWDWFANADSRIEEMRRSPDFHDEYARYRGLAFSFNCTDDINAGTDRIINLPNNHRFKLDQRVDFRLIDGALPGGLSEGVNYFVKDPTLAGLKLTATEGGATNINLLNGVGTAEMLVNIKPDLASLRTAIPAALDEIELNLVQRATTYDRANVSHTYSTRSTAETANLRTLLQDIENLIDVAPA